MTYSFLELAVDVLKSAATPLTYQQCWAEGQVEGAHHKSENEGQDTMANNGSKIVC